MRRLLQEIGHIKAGLQGETGHHLQLQETMTYWEVGTNARAPLWQTYRACERCFQYPSDSELGATANDEIGCKTCPLVIN